MATSFGPTTVLGYPRIGPGRELKRAVEAYWAGRIDVAALERTAAALRASVWSTLREAGIAAIPSNTFSYYDQMLDAAVAVGAVPPRFAALGLSPLDTYFAMARGTDAQPPLEMTKWFATNYHYLVPEIAPDTVFTPNPTKPLREYAESRALGIESRPVLIGPATFLLLSKASAGSPEGFRPFDRLGDLVGAYADLLRALADAGVTWVQLDEPAYVLDRSEEEIEALREVYTRLTDIDRRPRIFVATYFGAIAEALPALLDTPVEAVGLDLVHGPGNLAALASSGTAQDRTIVAGVVDGRNVWRTDLRAAAATLAILTGLAGEVTVGTSCSLTHVPVDLDLEVDLDVELRERLAFARQKVDETVLLGRALVDGIGALPAPIGPAPEAWRDETLRARLGELRPEHTRRVPYEVRAAAQRDLLGLPPLPTTTIGSFPQTAWVRKARANARSGALDPLGYSNQMRAEILRVIRLQERLGLDVLVHGEPERNDMVQYFGEQLDGFAATEFGWVQSYGSRCVRPPIIYGDVTRPGPMTVKWSAYAQSLTPKPVKACSPARSRSSPGPSSAPTSRRPTPRTRSRSRCATRPWTWSRPGSG